LRLAREDLSPIVRLYLAAAAQRIPVVERKAVIEGLIAHKEDATDQNLPLMYWYAMEPLVGLDRAAASALIARTQIPLLRKCIARRMLE
jgi:hypothetical protein